MSCAAFVNIAPQGPTRLKKLSWSTNVSRKENGCKNGGIILQQTNQLQCPQTEKYRAVMVLLSSTSTEDLSLELVTHKVWSSKSKAHFRYHVRLGLCTVVRRSPLTHTHTHTCCNLVMKSSLVQGYLGVLNKSERTFHSKRPRVQQTWIHMGGHRKIPMYRIGQQIHVGLRQAGLT